VYVEVVFKELGQSIPTTAATVLIRDDSKQKLSGTGVITRVVSPVPDAVFEADGYLIHITSSTQLEFQGDIGSLAEVSTNTWIHFSGKRGKDGILEAAKAQFIPAKPTQLKAVKNIEVAAVKTRPSGDKGNAMTSEATGTAATTADGADLQQDEQLKIGFGRWHTLPADQPLQQRVHRIGMALVPAYQREMAGDNPSKIHFRFFAVDNNGLRGATCLLDGAILVSKQTVERLSSDDQLAAIIADGVACNLQRQIARTVIAGRKDMAFGVASMFVPGLGISAMSIAAMSASKEEFAMQAEQLRIALALMRNAGFDPWQAPEAWRLLDTKELPANLASLQYPYASCYQIEILNLQYQRK
jgi:hypothetical protein